MSSFKQKLIVLFILLPTVLIVIRVSLSKRMIKLSTYIKTENCEVDSTIRAKNEFKKKLKNIALDEWDFFDQPTIEFGSIIKHGKTEIDEGYWQRVNTYWKDGTGFDITGKDTDWPWSAAFISWLMRKAGAEHQFIYSIRHSDYITKSIKNRKLKKFNLSLIGYRLNEYSPDIGDLVCYARQKNINYNTKGKYKSHCDIVVGKQKDRIYVIGGNVMDSVARKSLSLNSKNELSDSSENWFVIIKNNIAVCQNI